MRLSRVCPAAIAAALVLATPLSAQIDLSCSSNEITVYAENGWPHYIVHEVEPGKSYEVACRYRVWFPLAASTFELPPWKIKVQADGEVLKVADGPQEPVGVFGQMGIGVWSNVLFADWIPKTSGSHGIMCALDTTNSIPEKDESNNVCIRGLGPARTARPLRPEELEIEAKAHLPGVVPPQRPPATPVEPKPEPLPERLRAAAPRGVAPVSGSEVFTAPMWDGKRVDLCLVWGGQCGEPAATEFCKRSGYAKATAWQPARDIGAQTPTVVLGSGQTCSQPFCDGFASITCKK